MTLCIRYPSAPCTRKRRLSPAKRCLRQSPQLTTFDSRYSVCVCVRVCLPSMYLGDACTAQVEAQPVQAFQDFAGDWDPNQPRGFASVWGRANAVQTQRESHAKREWAQAMVKLQLTLGNEELAHKANLDAQKVSASNYRAARLMMGLPY